MRLMRFFSKFGLALALIAGAAAPVLAIDKPAAAAIDPELEHAVAALRAITTLRADFSQTDRNGQRVTGVLTLKRPGMIRFQYAPSVPLLIVSDGHALTMIDKQVNQIQRWPINNSPLGALLDPRRDVARFGTLQHTADRNVISIDVRDTKHPEYGVINLIFVHKASAPGGLELVAWVALDSQNHRTTIRLSNQQYGMAVSNDLFTFTDPRARPHK